ncbi:MAG TPA: hypothetical protein VE988_21980 [Gemmataceae bacterium]|nr:hypothetical protein [Gemmataceae bacterium]
MTPAAEAKARENGDPAYLIIDTESVPDGKLLAAVKHPGENVAPEEAVRRLQDDLRAKSSSGSDFVPVPFQFPVAICILRVGADFGLQAVTRVDEPHYKPRQIVEQFWSGLAKMLEKYKGRVRLVSFNGRGFDLPLLEMAAFRYGCTFPPAYTQSRKRFDSMHIDVMEFLSNYGAIRMGLGQNVLSKLLGKPGKMEVSGNQVYPMFLEGKLDAINDYCMFDTLDLYFVFLRTRVMTGELTLAREHELVLKAKEFLTARVEQIPALRRYLDSWGDWNPWP